MRYYVRRQRRAGIFSVDMCAKIFYAWYYLLLQYNVRLVLCAPGNKINRRQLVQVRAAYV